MDSAEAKILLCFSWFTNSQETIKVEENIILKRVLTD